MNFKAIIVDDEKHGRENLVKILLGYCPEVEFISEAESADEVQSPEVN